MKTKIVVLLAILAFSVFGQMQYTDSSAYNAKTAAAAIDTVSIDTSSNTGKAKKLPIIKRSINYSIAAKFAIGTMLFIAFLLTAGDAWNPGD